MVNAIVPSISLIQDDHFQDKHATSYSKSFRKMLFALIKLYYFSQVPGKQLHSTFKNLANLTYPKRVVMTRLLLNRVNQL